MPSNDTSPRPSEPVSPLPDMPAVAAAPPEYGGPKAPEQHATEAARAYATQGMSPEEVLATTGFKLPTKDFIAALYQEATKRSLRPFSPSAIARAINEQSKPGDKVTKQAIHDRYQKLLPFLQELGIPYPLARDDPERHKNVDAQLLQALGRLSLAKAAAALDISYGDARNSYRRLVEAGKITGQVASTARRAPRQPSARYVRSPEEIATFDEQVKKCLIDDKGKHRTRAEIVKEGVKSYGGWNAMDQERLTYLVNAAVSRIYAREPGLRPPRMSQAETMIHALLHDNPNMPRRDILLQLQEMGITMSRRHLYRILQRHKARYGELG